ncbi:MAG TPA: FAD-dependent oxidoreductase [Candidatus Fimivivens faecavium]|nr:FAD-dependent oxidoreductase [Candidatus Fimivivens faecavium]
MVDILIIGAGPAGLSAAVYACRAGHSVVVLEENLVGGQIASSSEVENYPAVARISGADFAMNLYEQAAALGAKVEFEPVERAELAGPVKKLYTPDGVYEGRTVIIANGAKRRKLGAPGEEEFAGRGVSYCATCDGAFYRGKEVAIVGGGNTALEDALFLANNCKTVHLIHRRGEFRGNKILADAAVSRENIVIHYHSVVEKIEGEKQVGAVSILSGEAEKQPVRIPVSGVFIAVGTVPGNALFEGQLELDAAGYLVAGEDCLTKIPGVYVAGDTRTKQLRQLVTANADGAVAAVAASTYLATLEASGS